MFMKRLINLMARVLICICMTLAHPAVDEPQVGTPSAIEFVREGLKFHFRYFGFCLFAGLEVLNGFYTGTPAEK